MTRWDFTVILKGVEEISDDLANSLYEAGCDDGTAGSSDGVASISFSRDAETLQDAIRSALTDIRRAGCVAGSVRIEQEEFSAWPTA